MKTVFAYICSFIWLLHLMLGVGAFYAALRLWPSRKHSMIGWLAMYIQGFVLEALTAIVLLFVAKGVVFTWKFTAVMFIGTFLGDIVRAPLIIYLMKGPKAVPIAGETSGDLPPEFWKTEFRKAVRDEIVAMREEGLIQ